LIKKGKLNANYIKTLKNLIKLKKEFKKGKVKRNEVEEIRKNASLLINDLVEYNQRCELSMLKKARIILKTKNKSYELVLGKKKVFLIDEGNVSSIDLDKGKLVKSSVEELTKCLEEQKKNPEVVANGKIFDILKKNIGDFEILL